MVSQETQGIEVVENRHENGPVNYINAVRCILESQSPLAAFRVIYSMARQTIPSTLFKYYSLTNSQSHNDEQLNERKFATLQSKRVFASFSSDMNDPFDGRGYFYRAEPINAVFSQSNPGFDFGSIDFASHSKITSFTACGYQSMPMWAHYANNHHGFCVSYEMNESNAILKSFMWPIQYSDVRIDVTRTLCELLPGVVDSLDNDSACWNSGKLEKVLEVSSIPLLLENIKHSFWAYEQEYRFAIAASKLPDSYAMAEPKEICIGINCSEPHEKRLISIGKELGIPVRKMVFDPLSPTYSLAISNPV